MSSDQKIIFICYVNRSGSTYLANLFSKSPDILVCPEADILVNRLLVQPNNQLSLQTRKILSKAFVDDPKLKSWNLAIKNVSDSPLNFSNFQYFQWIINNYKEKLKPKATTIVFKAERLIQLYENYINLNKKFNIYWITIIRDVRAVYYSQSRILNPDTNKIMSENSVFTSLFWNNFANRCQTYSKNNDFEIIYYEKLIQKLDQTFNRLLNIFNIPSFEFTESKGDLWDRLPQNHKFIHKNIIGMPKQLSVDEWQSKLSERDIFMIQSIAHINLVKLGYKVKLTDPRNKLFLILESYILVIIYTLMKSLKKVKYHLLKLI